MKGIKFFIISLLAVYLSKTPVFAEEVPAPDNLEVTSQVTHEEAPPDESEIQLVTLGKEEAQVGRLEKEENQDNNQVPTIVEYVVNGEVDPSQKGVDFYQNISITLIGDNLTDRHFLTKEGLHWSDKTRVEVIRGKEVGILNDSITFGV